MKTRRQALATIAALTSCAKPNKNRLNVFNWSAYVAPETIPNFEKEFGVSVRYSIYESNEEMLARVFSGNSGWDVVFPTHYIVPPMREQNLLAALDKSKLPNLKNLDPTFQHPISDPGLAHSVPYMWNATGIQSVQISVGETVGLEGRGDYYDGMGALRDMVQNHMLQLLALVAMEPPARLDPAAVRDEKVKVLRSLRPITAREVESHSVRGQYGAGAILGQPVPGYLDELAKPSDTETFVALKAHVDNWRWKGVPFYLRTGKRVPERVSEIIVQFRDVPHSMFGDAALKANKLIISIQPDENVGLQMMAKVPGLDRDGLKLRAVPLDIGMTNAFADVRRRIAYERLMLDLVEGRQTLFVRRDEVEQAWTFVDGLEKAWLEAQMTPKPYLAGSWGPSGAFGLTERSGRQWLD